MADIVVIGGGGCGLATAMLLAQEGHAVTVLERDPAPPTPADDAWFGWERRGVNQFRMIHLFGCRWRKIVETELPHVIDALLDAGALRFNPIALAPAEMTGGFRDGDERFDFVTGRRPVVEAVLASVAASTPGVTIRRGEAVAGLRTGTSLIDGIPHVIGVRTESGDDLDADLVVDMSGRRSALPRWLDAVGARKPDEEVEDCGFVYYGRHFRSADGEQPPLFGGILQPYESVSTLTLPCDNGTWGVGLITSAGDADLRKLSDTDTWMRAWKSYPLVAHWVDAEPLDEAPAVMAKIEDRHRAFMVDGQPVATGVLAVADSWACTNPSLGRGVSIGMIHAQALRDELRTTGLDDAVALAKSWDATTAATVQPWYDTTLSFDRHRLAEIDAQIAGRPYETEDPTWAMTKAMEHAVGQDGEVFRAFLSIASVQNLPEEALSAPGVFDAVIEKGAGWEDAVAPGPTREELVSIVRG